MATLRRAATPSPQPAPAKSSTARKAAPSPAAARKTPAASKAATAPAKAAVAPVVEKEPKAKKPKLVRDSFTIPKDEYAAIEALKLRAAALSQPAKKSELLRAGLKALAAMSDAALQAALQAVPAIKTGRPKSDK